MVPATRRDFLGLIVLVVTVALTYFPVLDNGFVWDDDLWLTANPAVHSPGDLGAIWSLGYNRETRELRSTTTQYYPLVFSSFWLENRIWGLAPGGYHVVNVVLHFFNALLVWGIGRRLRIPGAWLVGAIFALHPIQVESVAWITQRRNVLSGLFYLLAMWSYLRFDKSEQWRDYGLAFGLFICALLSKTVTATLPFALLLVIFRHRQCGDLPPLGRRNLWPLIPMLATGVVAGLVTANLEQGAAGASILDLDFSLGERLFILVPSTFFFYAWKIIWPFPVVFVYPRWEINAGDIISYLPFLTLMAGLAAAVWTWRRHNHRGVLLSLMFAGLTLAPALGFIDVFFFRYSFVADHWQYLGSLGFIVLVVGALTKLGKSRLSPARFRFFAMITSVLVLAVLAVASHRQVLAYHDAETLWRDTIRKNPSAWIALNNLGKIEMQRALASRDLRQQDRWLQASKSHFEEAVKFEAARPEAYNNLATIAYLHEDYRKAVELFMEAIELQPDDPRPYFNLGLAFNATGQRDQAVEFFEKVLADGSINEPLTRAEVLHQLALAQASMGLWDQAAANLDLALDTYPSLPNIQVFRASVSIRLNRYGEAMTRLQNVEPASNEFVSARVALVRLWATCPDPALRNCRQARGLLRELNQFFAGRKLPKALVDVELVVSSACDE